MAHQWHQTSQSRAEVQPVKRRGTQEGWHGASQDILLRKATSAPDCTTTLSTSLTSWGCQTSSTFPPLPQVLSAAASLDAFTLNCSPSKQYPFKAQAKVRPFWVLGLRISSVFTRASGCWNLQPWNCPPPHLPGIPPTSGTAINFPLPQMPTGQGNPWGRDLMPREHPAALCSFGLQTPKGKSSPACLTHDRQRNLQPE